MSSQPKSSVAILLLPGFQMAALGVLLERFTLAGGCSPLIFSTAEQMVPAEHGVRVQAQELPDVPLSSDTVVVCGGRHFFEPTRQVRERLVRHTRASQYRIGIGSGVLLMAQSGLLEGKQYSLAEGLRGFLTAGQALVSQGPVTCDGRTWTCADESALTAMLDTLLPAWSRAGRESSVNFQSEVEERSTLAEAQMLMRNNLAEPLATGEIAGYLGISSKKLERIFKRFVGQLPARFYIGLRLTLARDLLHHSGCSIEEIGKRCGFTSPSHFSRAFRNHFGCSPRTERQQFTSMPETHYRWQAIETTRRAG